MNNEVDYSFKICLVGEGGVGKTSLIKRFVFDQFSDKYITTLGTKITKKEVTLKHPRRRTSTNIRMLVWDIMGQQGFRQMLQNAYFFGCQGVVAVCDITRRDTMLYLEDWVKAVYSISGEVPIVFLANKCDLKKEAEINIKELDKFCSKFKRSYAYLSSAKTGKNVELGFFTLGEEILSSD
ncbi:MAG: GTP-binding protein [Thermoplasmata archaeon]|nr:MAG: GTP-binding protein [Thermoplasmata archaeon]